MMFFVCITSCCDCLGDGEGGEEGGFRLNEGKEKGNKLEIWNLEIYLFKYKP